MNRFSVKPPRLPQVNPAWLRRFTRVAGLLVYVALLAAAAAWGPEPTEPAARVALLLALAGPPAGAALMAAATAGRLRRLNASLREELDRVRTEARVAAELPKLAESDQPAAEVARLALTLAAGVVNLQWGGLIVGDGDGVAVKPVLNGGAPPELRLVMAGLAEGPQGRLAPVFDARRALFLDGPSAQWPGLHPLFEAGARALAFLPAGQTGAGGQL
ncbi:MAG TPA: hypothetical protein VHN99_00260, partial [Deinococcales bacterium]|nr:hypothetical protein [Deinococcales bacterium]